MIFSNGKYDQTLARLGSIVLNCTNAPEDLTACWIYIDANTAPSSLLDRGAEKLIFSDLDHIANEVPLDRSAALIQISFGEELVLLVEALKIVALKLRSCTPLPSTVILEIKDFPINCDLNIFNCMLQSRFPELDFVLMVDCKLSYQLISAIRATGPADNKLQVIIPATQVSLTKATNEMPADKLDLGQILSSQLRSDRSDHLLPTIVCDEQGIALGLVYSNQESLSEAIYSGQGVYHSRKRGLWQKDCDSDAIQFIVHQHGSGFCHKNTRTCWGTVGGLAGLSSTLESRMKDAPTNSYTKRLFDDQVLLKSSIYESHCIEILEEAQELCDAKTSAEVASESADLIYFTMVRCASQGVSLSKVEKLLDSRRLKVTRRPGNAKHEFASKINATKSIVGPLNGATLDINGKISMKVYNYDEMSCSVKNSLLERPIMDTELIVGLVKPILAAVRANGDAAVLEFTKKFDNVDLKSTVLKQPFPEVQLEPQVKAAIDVAFANILKFHEAQIDMNAVLNVETMPGVTCSRFVRPIGSVGLYVPGGSAVLPSTALMLGIPAMVAGCKNIIIATPPKRDGSVCPEVMYVAKKVDASMILLAGGAQAIAAMAYGTESVPKVDKICGPGNQFVTTAKMMVQNDTSAMVAIDMPAGPSELLIIADNNCDAEFVVSDLLSQAEHGPDSQVILLGLDLSEDTLQNIDIQLDKQARALERCDIIRKSISHSHIIKFTSKEDIMMFSNQYAPEHLILHVDDTASFLQLVDNAGSIFVGKWAPESCGDYASGTNHTLPTYGYAKMYSGVNTNTFVKHITSQTLTQQGLLHIGKTVMDLAEVEGLGAHKNAVAIRMKRAIDQ